MQDVIYFVHQNLFLTLAWVGTLALFIGLEIKIRKFGPARLTTADLVELINRKDALVFDLRPSTDFNKGHIGQSENFHLSEIHDTNVLLKKLEASKDRPVVLVCKDGMKSSQEAFKLKKNNIRQVGYLNGGVTAWMSEGLPTVSG